MSGCGGSTLKNDLLEAALSYAGRGWRVFPLHSVNVEGKCSCGGATGCKPAKHPRTRHGFKDATTDEKTIREWWAKWPDANIGIATGKESDFVVLDIDNKNDGMTKLRQLESQYGDLPPTLTIRTGNGFHLGFRAPKREITCRTALAGLRGLDFKGEGGYVVAPPSRHANGNIYLVEHDPGAGKFASMPDWLIKMITAPAPKSVLPQTTVAGKPVPEGQRNEVLFRLACSLRAKGLTEAAVTAALKAENAGRCEPPLTLGEVLSIARSAARYPNSANSANSAKQGGDSIQWDALIPFHEFDLPKFPTEALPQPLRAFVEAVATATQTPPDLAAMLVLSTVAAAVGRKVRIRVKQGYSEPVNIFTVTALPPANRKSAVFTEVTAPLVEFETEQAQQQAPEIRAAQARRDIAEEKLHRAQKEAARHSDDPTKLEEVERLARELAKMKVPTSPRLIADDTTPEKLSALLTQQDGRMAVMSPEGGVFDLMAGRYSQNNSPNFEVYLKGHAGDTLRVDRMGRAEYVERPALTLGLAVQPKVLEGLTSKTEFRGRGLLGRFLYSFPKSLVGHRDVDAPAVPAEARADYYRCIARLVRFTPDREEFGLPKEHVLTLDPGARSQMRDAEIWIEEQLREFGELGSMPDWGGKWLGAVARIGALLHMAEQAVVTDSWATPVVRKTVERALTIGKYLIPQAKAAYAAMEADPEVTAAQHVLRWIRHRVLESFTKRDAFEGTKGRFDKVPEMEPALTLLEDHNYIRQRPPVDHPGRGRKPSPTYDVNPIWLSQNSHNSQNPSALPSSANTANCANANQESNAPPEVGDHAGAPEGLESRA